MLKFLAAMSLIALAMPAAAEPFPESIVTIFLTECTGGEAALQAYCDCTIKELQDRMTLTEFEALGQLSEDQVMKDEKFSGSVVACAKHVQ